MSKIYLYNYNNYFNRIVKKEASLNDYGQAIYSLATTNFNYNDGVETYHDINYAKEEGDYLIVTETENNVETIVSRWFVIENKRLRGGQHRLQLRRDLVVDNYDKIINSPMIVDRAMIKDSSNPLLFNPEGFSFNQIKKREIPLTDAGKIQWYVLYFKELVDGNNNNFTGQITNPNLAYDLTISNFSLTSGTYYRFSDLKLNVKYTANGGGLNPSNTYKIIMESSTLENQFQYYGWNGNNILFNSATIDTIKPAMSTAFNNKYSTLLPLLLNDIGGSGITEATYNTYKSYNNKIIHDPANNKVYRVTMTESLVSEEKYLASGTYFNEVKSIIDNTGYTYQASTLFSETAGYSYNGNYLDIEVEDITTSYTLEWELDFGNKIITIDSDFSIIAIPVESCHIRGTNSYSGTQEETISKQLVNSIIKEVGENCVDIQVLPYCPIQKAVGQTGSGNTILLDDLQTKQYDILADSNDNVPDSTTCILYIQNSNFTFNIQSPLYIGNYTTSRAINKKVENECKLYKLVSPNYNGSFEFSLAKNGDTQYFNVDVSLIPYTPYIHVNPVFANIYGQDFDDSRGLICGGDFSLPRRQNQWTNYKIQNKNYQEIFDRQMRNMDFTQSQERAMSYIDAFTGTLTAGAGGVAGGLMTGRPAGAIAGGIIGAGSSLIGGIADIGMTSARQQEQKSYAIDTYNFKLGNIKALPDNLTKVTPFTYNYKKFPFIEVYSATNEEINLFINFLTFRSMKINAIGKIFDYLDSTKTFIKGTLIRLEDFDLCSHEAFEIYKEIEEGVYI